MSQATHRIALYVARHPLASFAVILVASEIFYLYAFVRRYALLVYWNVPLLDLGKIARRDPLWAAEFAISFIALFALYAIAVWLCRSQAPHGEEPRSKYWLIVIGGVVVFGLTLLFVFPIGAGDVFDYIVHGVVLAQHHVSPHVNAGSNFPQEPLVGYSGWRMFPSYYGPVWSWLEAGINWLAGPRDLLANLIGFKALALAALLLDAWLISRIVAQRAPERALVSVVAFAWNPLVLFEAVVNGHNDLVMLACVLAALLTWERKRWEWAVVLMTLSALVKVATLPLLGLLLVAVVAQAQRRADKLRCAAISVALVALTIAAAYLTLPQPFDSIRGLMGRAEMFTNSLPALVKLLLQFVLPRSIAAWLVRTLALFALELFLLWQAWSVWKQPERLLRACCMTVAFMLLAVTLWFQAWYVLWLVALAAACSDGRAMKLAALFGLSATWAYVVYGFVWFWFIQAMNWGNTLGVQATGFVVTYGLPLGYLIYMRAKKRVLLD